MKKLKHLLVAVFIIVLSVNTFSQGVGINTDESDADPSAMLDVKSTDKGFLTPRMTQEQVLAIASPAEGLLVFATDIGSFMYFANGQWNTLNSDLGTGWGTISTIETQYITPSNTGDSLYGKSVEIDGDYCIVGLPYNTVTPDTCTGKAYILHYNGNYWDLQATLTASDGANYNYFGFGVSISGDYAVVGAYGNNSGQGKVYVFHRAGTTWTQEAQLIANDGAAGDHFGYSVSIQNTSIAVGANNKNAGQGKVYIFHNNGSSWVSQGEIDPPYSCIHTNFGLSVAICGDYVAIGQPNHYYTCYYPKAYIFYYDGTSWIKQLEATGNSSSNLGLDTDINGDYVVFGSFTYPRMFHRDGSVWTEQTIEDGRNGGKKVSFNGEWYVQGSYGQAYVYHRYGNTWKLMQNLSPSDNEPSFGNDVSISGSQIVVGAPYCQDYTGITGKIYFFKH